MALHLTKQERIELRNERIRKRFNYLPQNSILELNLLLKN